MPLESALSEDICNKIRVLDMARVVGIEGFMGSGKTELGNEIASNIGAGIIHLDDYALKSHETRTYNECINYMELKSCIDNFRNSYQKIIIEGICLQEVLLSIKIVPDFLIYIKRLSSNGIWHDGINLEEYPHNYAIPNELTLSDMKYHLNKRPHETANLIFHRYENNFN